MGWVAAIPLLPAGAFALMAPMSRKARNAARWLSVAAMAIALVMSLFVFAETWGAAKEAKHAKLAAASAEAVPGESSGELAEVYRGTFTFGRIGETELNFGILVDPVSAAMLVVITLVGTCVQVYSIGYMHKDERIGWYFAVLSLFSAAMLALVLADNFLMLYLAWEVMGLCSYLLIGFWHEQEAPRRASQKAFLTTRVGDVGFALGLAVMYKASGSFDFDVVLGEAAAWAPGVALACALLLLFGAMGKSAQVPLHVWLPDAMAGPTPASALIHAATMVAAGVYLVARALPIFEAAPAALSVTMFVGATTALVGGLLGAVQHDVKKVLAYSTISQLGYMFVALGAGGFVPGMFHLVTHAFFKSLLFLGAGVIIHACHTQDMREMGGLAKRMPWTTATFTAGSLALAGIFPLSGFWSKDEILTALWNGQHYVTFFVALLAAFVTAFYVARLWFRVFTGYAHHPKAKEGHAEMLAPMVLLAAITAVIGFSSPAFAGFLGHKGHWPAIGMAVGSSAVALSGLAVGWWVYGRPGAKLTTDSLKHRFGYLYDMLAQKLYFDHAYDAVFVRPFVNGSDALSRFDLRVVDGAVNGVAAAWNRLCDWSWAFDVRAIDGAVNGLGTSVRKAGAQLRKLQVGRVQVYQKYVLGAVVLLMLMIAMKGA